MRIQVIRAKTLPEALAIARADHGENAIVLDTEETGDGAIVRLGVEADTAAAEPVPPAPKPAPETAAAPRPASPQPTPWPATRPAIRQPDPLPNAGTSDQIAEALAWHGVPPLVMRSLLIAAEASGETAPVAALAIALDRVLRFGRPEDLRAPLALVGPPGAGKTATLIKLAATRSLAGGAIRIINADQETSGAVARIGAFADAMGITPIQAGDAEDIRRALVQDGTTFVDAFVDTVGRAPADADDIAASAAEIEAAGHGVLTLSAAIAPAEAAELAECFAAAGATSLIVTQLDIARRVGAMLAAADAGGLVLAGVSVGRKIGDGLRPLDGQSLARLIMAPPQPLPKWTSQAKAGPTAAYANVQAYASKGAVA